MEKKEMRRRSRSDASNLRKKSTIDSISGEIFHAGGHHWRTYQTIDLRHEVVDKRDHYLHSKYQTTSMEDVEDKKLKEIEDTRRQALIEMETLSRVGFGTVESDQALRRLTYQQFTESKADYPTRAKWEKTKLERIPQLQTKVFRKKCTSTGTKLPTINLGSLVTNHEDLSKSMLNVGL